MCVPAGSIWIAREMEPLCSEDQHDWPAAFLYPHRLSPVSQTIVKEWSMGAKMSLSDRTLSMTPPEVYPPWYDASYQQDDAYIAMGHRARLSVTQEDYGVNTLRMDGLCTYENKTGSALLQKAYKMDWSCPHEKWKPNTELTEN